LSNTRRVSFAWIIVCLLLLGGRQTGFAQADDGLWSQPVNLSHSGAAESPVLVAGPERQMQVFWWDRFDGVTTSYALGNDWSDPTPAPIQIGAAAGALLLSPTIAAMPQIVGVGETAFALWLGEPDLNTGLRSLLYSRLRLGTTEWTTSEALVGSAGAWEIMSDPQGVLHLVYCQTQQLGALLPGVYYIHSTDEGVTWSEPVALYTSLYTRLWTADTIHLSIVADALGNVLAGWDDPRQELAFYVLSTDDGTSWSEPTRVGVGEINGLHPRFIAIPAVSSRGESSGFMLLWEQETAASTCILQQQRSEDRGKTWSAATRVFEELVSCPVQVSTARTTDSLLLFMQGEETEGIFVAAWNGTQWSGVKQLGFSFDNPETEATMYLKAIQANIIIDDMLVVVGQGQDDDIWALQGQNDAVEWVFAPPSPWSSPAAIFEGETTLGFPAAVTDTEGKVHVLWGAPPSEGQSSSVLYYSRWDQTSWSRPVEILSVDEGMAQSPILAFAEPYLHAVWSDGSTGAVFYGRSYPSDAFSPSGWSQQRISDETVEGYTPAMTVDLLGQLHVVYAVPFNEGRGIYYTRTDDNGESWQEAVQLFDAVSEGWSSVDHPDVTVDEYGVIHVVWVRAPLPDYGLPQGVYYAQSADHGETWTTAVLLADGAYDWPQVAATLTGQIVVTWQDLTRNTVEYRATRDYGTTWEYVSQIPGLQTVEGRTVLVQDRTGRLHITALDTSIDSGITLHHVIYAEGQWSSLDPVELEGVYAPVVGAVPAVNGELGLIDVVGLGSQRDGLIPVIWHTHRTIESQAAYELNFVPPPTSTPTPGPTPLPTPTPRPIVDPYPSQPSVPVLTLGPISLPLLAFGGIGIALLLVAVLLVIKAIKR
jgi:hypothetical protein